MKIKFLLYTVLQFALFTVCGVYYLRKQYDKSFVVAKSSGCMISVNLFLTFACVNKIWKRWFVYNSIITRRLHMTCFLSVCFFSLIHVISYSVRKAKAYYLITGSLLVVLLCIFAGFGYCRQILNYKIFNRLHNVLVVLFLSVFTTHIVWKDNFLMYILIIFSVGLYIMNTLIDWCYGGYKVTINNCRMVTEDIVCLGLNLSSKYFGKTVYLLIPSIHKFEWHPFTVVRYSNRNGCLKSRDFQGRCCIYIKRKGDWTGDFINKVKTGEIDKCNIYISGPYKTLTDNFMVEISTEPVVLVATGIGITSFLDTIQKNCPKRRLYVVIIAKTITDVFWINEFKTTGVNFMIYLTGNDNPTDFEYTGSKRYYSGRPDFDDLFDNILIQNSFIEMNRVTVYFCGPENVYNKVKMVSKRYDTFRLIYI